MPPNPSEQACEWCPEPAVVCKEIKHKKSKGTLGIGQFLCACMSHRLLLNQTIDAKAGLKK